jgi:hypothetical protein
VPHTLTEAHRRERVEKSIELLSLLAKAKRRAWQFIITGDESLFFYVTSHSKIWLPRDADTPEVARQLINTPKVMITIFWNPFGIHFVAALPEKTSLDVGYFIDYVLTSIAELPVMHTAESQKQKRVIHKDNWPIHKSKAAIQKISSICVKLAAHRPYSPDLTPSDFFVFGYIKQKIAGQEFVSADDLLEAIREKFDRLSKCVLESLFDEWMIRLQTYIDDQYSYFPEGETIASFLFDNPVRSRDDNRFSDTQ